MTSISLFPPDVSLRRIALPVEHGGWGIVLEPVVLGLIVAPSSAGMMIGFAALLTFLARQPFKIASGDILVRRKAYPRTNPAMFLIIAYGVVAGGLLAGAVILSQSLFVIAPIAVAAPLAAVQIVFDVRNESRSMFPELSGAVAMSASASAILLAGGWSPAIAFVAWLLVAARSSSAILYVRARLRREQGRPWSATPAILAHGAGISGAVLTAFAGLAPKLAILAFLLLASRCIQGLTRRFEAPDARLVGWNEVAWGLVTVVLIGVGWRVGL